MSPDTLARLGVPFWRRNQGAPVVLLDWWDRCHWSNTAAPCRLCGDPTNLLDAAARPAHKWCAEREVTRWAADPGADCPDCSCAVAAAAGAACGMPGAHEGGAR